LRDGRDQLNEKGLASERKELKITSILKIPLPRYLAHAQRTAAYGVVPSVLGPCLRRERPRDYQLHQFGQP
jgi:hypothetical protein